MAPGFELVGHIPEVGVLGAKTVPATLSPAEVRGSAKRVRSGVIVSIGKGAASPLAQDLYDITINERDHGWLERPLGLLSSPITLLNMDCERFAVTVQPRPRLAVFALEVACCSLVKRMSAYCCFRRPSLRSCR